MVTFHSCSTLLEHDSDFINSVRHAEAALVLDEASKQMICEVKAQATLNRLSSLDCKLSV